MTTPGICPICDRPRFNPDCPACQTEKRSRSRAEWRRLTEAATQRAFDWQERAAKKTEAEHAALVTSAKNDLFS